MPRVLTGHGKPGYPPSVNAYLRFRINGSRGVKHGTSPWAMILCVLDPRGPNRIATESHPNRTLSEPVRTRRNPPRTLVPRRGREPTDRSDGAPTRRLETARRPAPVPASALRLAAATTTPRSGAGGAAGVVAAFSPQTGQHFGQNAPRWNTGWCIFSARAAAIAAGGGHDSGLNAMCHQRLNQSLLSIHSRSGRPGGGGMGIGRAGRSSSPGVLGSIASI